MRYSLALEDGTDRFSRNIRCVQFQKNEDLTDRVHRGIVMIMKGI
jgi:hypothetical protein